jgi:hypothetical protein
VSSFTNGTPGLPGGMLLRETIAKPRSDSDSFRSAGFFPQIIPGKTNVSIRAALSLASVFKLKVYEVEYFENLVHFNQAETLRWTPLFGQDSEEFLLRNPAMF